VTFRFSAPASRRSYGERGFPNFGFGDALLADRLDSSEATALRLLKAPALSGMSSKEEGGEIAISFPKRIRGTMMVTAMISAQRPRGAYGTTLQ
jgi:hypothetical protein